MISTIEMPSSAAALYCEQQTTWRTYANATRTHSSETTY